MQNTTQYGTDLVQVIVDYDPDPLNLMNEQIGSIVYTGYSFYAIIMLISLISLVWVTLNKTNRVVKTSQPFFLNTITIGTIIFGSAIVPLSIDDQHYTKKQASAACMTKPWLLSIGFTTIFSALE